VDASAAALALTGAYWLRIHSTDLLPWVDLLRAAPTLPPLPYYTATFTIPAILLYLALIASLGLYGLRTTIGAWREFGRVILAAITWLAIIIAWFFLIQKQLFFSRALLIQATALLGILTIVGRGIVILIQRALLRRGIGARRLLSCGSRELPEMLRSSLAHDPRYIYAGHKESVIAAEERLMQGGIDVVLHTDPSPESKETIGFIEWCRSHHIDYAFLPAVFADVPQQLSVRKLGDSLVLRFEPTPLDGWGRVFKRGMDLVLSILFLVFLSPIILIIALLVLLTSGWPIFYVSKRMGQYGKKTIPMLKFRTMCVNADAQRGELSHLSHRSDGPLFKVKNDPRITPLGRALRRFSLDELPQLFNVLCGHLSLVGPRPHLPEEVARYAEHQRRVFTVRPGVTGLPQISGRSDLSFEQEVLLDMRYIEEWSLGLDLFILWRTIFVVLGGKGAD
jgi:exopolysaccharide biosynthesis polyprenyl glycosylphosphotransferase